jgi:hypothetical protein
MIYRTLSLLLCAACLIASLADEARSEERSLLGRGSYSKKTVEIKRFGTGEGAVTTGKDEATGKKIIRVQPLPKEGAPEHETPPIFVYPEVEYRQGSPRKSRTIPEAASE